MKKTLSLSAIVLASAAHAQVQRPISPICAPYAQAALRALELKIEDASDAEITAARSVCSLWAKRAFVRVAEEVSADDALTRSWQLAIAARAKNVFAMDTLFDMYDYGDAQVRWKLEYVPYINTKRELRAYRKITGTQYLPEALAQITGVVLPILPPEPITPVVN
ncbi:MAG TPA: hypothetical protein VM901_07850 [Bdellovibrionota bacterium]|nr:hypothetical protein [Bdellovibrionota bacterium]